MEKISSRQNPRVKYLAGLHNRKKRKETGEIILEGPNLIKEAQKTGILFLEVMATQELLQKEKMLFPEEITVVTEEVMAKIAPSKTSQGIVARIKRPVFSWKDILGKNRLLILDGLQDPGNVGTLIRTAAGADFGGVVLLGEGADPYQPKALRASAGAIFKIPLAEIPSPETKQFITEMESSFLIYKAEPRGGKDYRQVEFGKKCALILGHETRGFSPEFEEVPTTSVSISLTREVESLNVAAAGAVLLFGMKS